MYARRIKSLGHPTRKIAVTRATHPLDPNVLHLLSACREDLLLPNLHSLCLTVDDIDRGFLHHSSLLVGSPLKHFSLSFLNDIPKDTDSMISSIRHICATCDLEDFELISLSFPGRAALITDVLRPPASFRKFWVFDLSHSHVVRLASLPELREVKLGFRYDNNLDFLANASLSSYFPSLQVLNISVASLAICGDLLRIMGSANLRDLSVIHSGPIASDPNSFLEFFTLLNEHCSHSSLQAVTILQSGGPDGSLRSYAEISARSLAPMFVFSRLTDVYVDCSCTYDLNNDSLAQMARAWPKLEALTLGVDHGWEQLSNITFHGLSQLVRLCPKLHAIGVAVNVSVDDLRFEDPEIAQSSNGRVTRIDLGDSAMGEVDPVAKAFAHLFPNLCSIWIRRPVWQEAYTLEQNRRGGDIANDYWNAVQRQVRAYADAAAQGPSFDMII
ncbi:uncharacterized protein FIBRA_05118 [Fibroporia radiculosa]|uniref:F-box domain-containing protein n=1 Tax=Fibroporia radiculosa TaxID=599839 RepID=J4G8K8_9APHY|nr:uncharacterized protein FIBRA_05118 [Fibroporia radiculosa]CCM03003.1 predicted protein [Fibroporia radiculosa]